MANRRDFDIAFVGLKPGIHVFEYRLEDQFFLNYGNQDFSNCIANIKLHLDKHAGFMQLKFDIDGTVNVNCDRCGNTIQQQLWDEFNIIVKMTDEPEIMNEQEEDPDIYYISRGESHIHISDWLYEFVSLSVPMQNICGNDENGKSLCNQEVITKLEQMQAKNINAENQMWKGLEQFKDLEKE
ncbi:MAG TPA: DUF177 domain-containing protein [Chitinophagaceae bacterium]|nr:DUF177 domain-containing protein [Chitinophagaceae bacterium]MCC6635285.1 DUF177 domain-containing protein [Chitinophagaceae bacterium]HMZ46463.1 DUF177 domain-containing protein [Chitinophagaceae bacterium]HNM34767.1 DUF177 domain-containing protein [Chitinophagaceae bacterium]HNN30459.1 DUF177 domain-containing protein [Chitinophagaceae bacterium]